MPCLSCRVALRAECIRRGFDGFQQSRLSLRDDDGDWVQAAFAHCEIGSMIAMDKAR